MRLPGGESAIVDLVKLTGYCLDPEHPRGRHKARVFAAALGVTSAHADLLRAALRAAAAAGEARPALADQFGERYVLEFRMQGPSGAATVVSTWIILRGEHRPRLTSCFVK